MPTGERTPAPDALRPTDRASSPSDGRVAPLATEHSLLLDLQRRAGNAAVTAHLFGRPHAAVQRVSPAEHWPADTVRPHEFHRLPEGYGAMSEPQKLAAIAQLNRNPDRSARAIATSWQLLDDELGQARANPELFRESLVRSEGILDHAPFQPLRDQFKNDVENTARGYTAANRDEVEKEMERTGVRPAAGTKGRDADADVAVQDYQRFASEIARVKRAKQELLSQPIGTVKAVTTHSRVSLEDREPAFFAPGGKPRDFQPDPQLPSWEAVNAEWQRAAAVEGAILREHPTAAYFIVHGGDVGTLARTGDIQVARAEVGRALNDLLRRINKAEALIGDDLTYLDFPPIHRQLMDGQIAGRDWSAPFERAIAEKEIRDASFDRLMVTLGVGSVAALFFVAASIATAGGFAAVGAGLIGSGVLLGFGQAAYSWDQYADLAAARDVELDPERALVTQEQVDEAFLTALLDTVFAALDLWQGAKSAYVGLKGGAVMLEAGRAGAGARAGLRQELTQLGRAGDRRAVIAAGLEELGAEQTRRLTGLSYADLAHAVGRDSEQGQRLVRLAAAAPSARRTLLEQLPDIAPMPAAQGGPLLQEALDRLGTLETLRRIPGGWGALRKSQAMKSSAGEALERWRAGITKELQEFITRESAGGSKVVRTGTEAATSDLDVQILRGEAAVLQSKAEGWLAGRLGTSASGAKKLLDAEIFIDPIRSHLIDVLPRFDSAVRERIAAEMTAKERAMIFGARLRQAKPENVAGILEEAADLGVTPMRGFQPLSEAARRRAAFIVDRKVGELKAAVEAGAKSDELEPLVTEIADIQARINASHPDAYVGGGVRVWVTGREGDAAKIAEAMGISVKQLTDISAAQRLTAALSEAKWLEAAARELEVPRVRTKADFTKLHKAIVNIGKHGRRSAEQLRMTEPVNVETLTRLMDQLEPFGKYTPEAFQAARNRGEIPRLKGELFRHLSALEAATKTAVVSLGEQARTANVDLTALAEWHALLDWQILNATAIDAARDSLTAWIALLGVGVRSAREASTGETASPRPGP